MRPLAFVILLALAACDTLGVYPPEAPVTAADLSLTTDRSEYRSGDDVTLTLRNDGDREVLTGVLTCSLLERRTDDGWTRDVDRNERGCILLGITVPPGDAYTDEADLDGVRAGTYRFVQAFGDVEVATGSFVVR
ncbi:immunoglobulin-like domain-containing protein [Rubrivirga sp.]|uniref:immunoglobulin-like domain-containing protein n=1 Tax=Rubrivirga sp. TaxID=1885344 RepID=UPI003B5241CE